MIESPVRRLNSCLDGIGGEVPLGDIRNRAVSASVVTALSQATKFALNLTSAVVLARLLLPEDFGLVAMVNTVTGLLLVFKDAGLSTVTIQRTKITQAQVSNLFWINVAMSAVLGLIVAVLAPAVAWFYRDPRLTTVTLILSSTFILSGAVVQHQALFNRQMRFKAMAGIEIGAAVTGLLTGIVMASWGWSYWSLVAMQVATSVAEMVLTLSISSWRPHLPKRGSGTLPLIQLGASLTVASVMRRIAAGADSLLIGRFHGADAVGLYSRGAILLLRPVDQLVAPLEAVFTPVLSRLQEDHARYRRTFLQVYGAVAAVSFPVAGLFLALSHPLVVLILGKRWDGAVPIFACFTIAALYLPLYYVVMWLLNTQGRGRDIMVAGIVVSLGTVTAIVVGIPFGAFGVAASIACIGFLVRIPVLFQIVGRKGPVSTRDLWAVVLRYLPSWALAFGVTFMVHQALPRDASELLQLLVSAPAGVFSVIALALTIPAQQDDILRIFAALKPWWGRWRAK